MAAEQPFSINKRYGTLSPSSTDFEEVQQTLQAEKEKGVHSVAIIVDIFRATTTIVYLLAMKARLVDITNGSSQQVKDTVVLKNGNPSNKYIDIGSDSSGNITFTMPNSPYKVVKQRAEVRDSVAIINTSKGSTAAVHAAKAGYDQIVIASCPTTNKTIEYLNHLATEHPHINIDIIVTEGDLNESDKKTEDSLYADFLENALLGRPTDFSEVQYNILHCRGANRFFRNQEAFPIQDAVLSTQDANLYNFLVKARPLLGHLIASAFEGPEFSPKKRPGFDEYKALENELILKDEPDLVKKLTRHFPTLNPGLLLSRAYKKYRRESRTLLLHMHSLAQRLKKICDINKLPEEVYNSVLLLIIYHDSLKLLSSEEKLTIQKQLSLGEEDLGSHSLLIQTIFSHIGEDQFAHNLRHNSPQLREDVQNGSVTLEQLLLNIVDRTDISGKGCTLDEKFMRVVGQHKDKPFDQTSEEFAHSYIKNHFDEVSLELH